MNKQDFLNEKIQLCDKIQSFVENWIRSNHDRIMKATVSKQNFGCASVDYCVEQNFDESFIIYCDQGLDDALALDIVNAVKAQFGVNCHCLMQW